MGIAIYYFTGTGNSLYIARELKQILPEAELIPVVKAIRTNQFVTKEKKIGFVFPCHGLTIPIPIRYFVKRMDVRSSDYFFAIATRGGSIFHGFSIINKALKKQGKCLNASFVINMALNDPKLKYFTVPTKEELELIEIDALQKLKIIKNRIINKGNSHNDDKSGVTFSDNLILNCILERLIPFMTHFISPGIKKYFYADSNCTGCGICEKVCPSRKIKMEDNKPVWQKNFDCYLCYACVNYCPFKAVQIHSKFWMKSYTTGKGRYPHPYATVEDISRQKII
jgi:ferredoxin